MKGSTSPTGEREHEAQLEPASTARETARRRSLLRAAQAGDGGAREQLVSSSLGLVRSVASRYRDLGLPFDDLVQEGALGLLDAIDHYDPDRGACFETYSRFRIRRAIRNALTEKSRLIRLPKQVVERRRAIERAEARLTAAAAGRTATTAEIAALTGLPQETIRAVRSAQLGQVSLDEPVLADGSPLAGVVADPHAADPEVIALEHDRTSAADGRTGESSRAATAHRQLQMGDRPAIDVERCLSGQARTLAAPHSDDRTRRAL